jgi:dipeptidase E
MARDLNYLHEDVATFKKLGIPYQDIDIEGKSEQELQQLLSSFDVIYVQGGDPFYLLKCIKQSGFDKVIKELINKGKLYVGVSAGSYVAGPTLESTLWKKPQRTRHGLADSEPAMRLVDFLVLVHYQEKHKEAVSEGMKHTTYEVRILTDNQALLVQDGKVTLVGV